MTQADPWDEKARLEKQMEAELLATFESSGPEELAPGAPTEAKPPEASDERAQDAER